MRFSYSAAAAVGAVCVASIPAVAQTAVPPEIAKMIDAAYASGDDAAVKAVVDLAKKTNPDAAAAIDAQSKALADKREADRVKAMAEAGWTDLWKGEGQIGASISTGNTDEVGIAAGLRLERDGLKWRHKLNGLIDYQETSNIKVKERFFAGYDLNYKITDRLYAVGTLSWERDQFAGFDNRFIESLGLGYGIVRSDRWKVDVEGGVAARQTDYRLTGWESDIVGRAALDAAWKISDTATFTERAEVFFGGRTTTITSLTAITAKLMGALSARLSYDVKHETDPEPGRKATDTTTRASLVYDF